MTAGCFYIVNVILSARISACVRIPYVKKT